MTEARLLAVGSPHLLLNSSLLPVNIRLSLQLELCLVFLVKRGVLAAVGMSQEAHLRQVLVVVIGSPLHQVLKSRVGYR
jgi:hypothetical protein